MQQARATSGPTATAEDRVGLRVGYKFPVRLDVQQPGAPRMTVHGVSQNLTPKGMRIRVSKKVVIGARCQVVFLHAGGRVIPAVVGATVRNSKKSTTATGEFEIGVQFDLPVEIKQPGKL